MRIDESIKERKVQYNIKRGASTISALSPDKIDKYDYITGEEILKCDEHMLI